MRCRERRGCLVVLLFATALAVGACSSSANQPPVLVDQQVTTDEDVAVELDVRESVRDPDGGALTVIRASAGEHRVEIVDGVIVRLTPMRDFHGTIEVSLAVSAGADSEAAGHATVTVRPVNDTPVALGGSRDIHGSNSIMLTGSDVDGDPLSYEVVGGPAHGSIAGTAPKLQYTPAPGFADDVITYRVSDGMAASEPAELRLRITPGAPPVAAADAVSVSEDGQLDVVLHASDSDGDTLAFTVVTPPVHGTLAGTAPNLVYTPARNYSGADSLQFRASDGLLSSEITTLTIQVAPVNDAPVATPQAVPAAEDTSTVITLGGSDIDGDALTFQVIASPSHGALAITGNGTLRYTPAQEYSGPDSFTFVAFDGTVSSSAARVDLNVAAVNDPPLAMSFTRGAPEDTGITVTLVGSDVEGSPLSYTVVTPPQHGVLEGTPPNLTYRPATDYSGSDSFTYTVSDGSTISAPGTVTLQLSPVNDPPAAINGTVATDEDAAVALTLQGSDVDGPALTFTILTPPSDGQLSGSGASWMYTPAPNAHGTRSFTFRVSDGGSVTDIGGFMITINPVNDPPSTRDDYVATDVGASLSFGASTNDLDIDGDSLAVAAVDPPANGSAVVVGGQLLYTPNAGFSGIDVFDYTISDGHGGSARGTARVGVGRFPPGAPTETIAMAVFDFGNRNDAPTLSEDGRYIAFVSSSAMVGDDTNGHKDVYVYDRGRRTLSRVSVASDGTQANSSSSHPVISANGRYVVFDSTAINLVSGDTNSATDVFRHDRVTGETVRVSVASDGGQASGTSSMATISDDGDLIAFTSSAFNLVPNDANGASDVFVREVMAGTTRRVSVSTTGGDGDLSSSEAVISGDGHRVAFSSSATNLIAGDGNNLRDIFVRDLVAGTTERVNVSTTGAEANAAASAPWLSRDGRFVSFVSSASNLVSPAGTSYQIFVRDTQAPTTTRPSTVTSIWGRLSGDGRYLTQHGSSSVLLIDRFAPATSNISNGNTWQWPVLSANGRYVVVADSRSGGVGVTVAPSPFTSP
jgi:Tol biopolymer transport system component